MTLDPANRWEPATFESEGGAAGDGTQTNGQRAARAHATLERYEQLSGQLGTRRRSSIFSGI